MTKMSNSKFEKTIPFLEERLSFIEAILKENGVTYADEKEWDKAKINISILLKTMKESNEGVAIDWLEFENEVFWLQQFVSDAISHTFFAIDVYENILKEKASIQYEKAVEQIENMKVVSEEVNSIMMYKK
jgi:uncharacterized coiled-coil protein SlyX